MCCHSIERISPRLMQVSIATSMMGQRYQLFVLEFAFNKSSYSPFFNLLSLGGLFLGNLIKAIGLSARSHP